MHTTTSTLLLLGSVALAGSLALPAHAQNPLSRKVAAADPWTRTFAGDGLTLVLTATDGGYRGTLRQGDASFPVHAAATGDGQLSGSFRVDAQEFPFVCQLRGDQLTLESDGERYALRAAASNPLAKAKATNDRDQGELAQLADVYQGEVTALRHPEGIFTGELPKGWSVARNTDEALLINPGLGETDTLDCILLVTWGELEEQQRGIDIVQLVKEGEPELLDGLRQQGIACEPSAALPRKVAVGDRAGAEQTWRGRTDGAAVQVWCGGVVEREYYLAVVAIVVQGKEQQFLPGARRLFRSLQPKAPEPNVAAQRSLAGATFGSGNQAGGSGSFHTVYSFRADGTVKKEMLMSGVTGVNIDVGGSSEEYGRYRVVGNVLYLQLKNGQEVARIEQQGEQVVALRFGNARYARR